MEIQRLMYSSGHTFFQQQRPFHLVEQILTVAKNQHKPAMSMLANKNYEDAGNSWSSKGREQTGKLFQNKRDSITLDQLYQCPARTVPGLAEMCSVAQVRHNKQHFLVQFSSKKKKSFSVSVNELSIMRGLFVV